MGLCGEVESSSELAVVVTSKRGIFYTALALFLLGRAPDHIVIPRYSTDGISSLLGLEWPQRFFAIVGGLSWKRNAATILQDDLMKLRQYDSRVLQHLIQAQLPRALNDIKYMNRNLFSLLRELSQHNHAKE